MRLGGLSLWSLNKKPSREGERPVRLFVVCSHLEDYFALLRGVRLPDGRAVVVDQAPWQDFEVTAFPDSVVVRINPQRTPLPDSPQHTARSFSPDVVLLRSFVLGTPKHDHREKMHAFFFANVPCINSLGSFATSIEKELLCGALRRVRDVCPSFPLIAVSYYSYVSV